MKFPFGGGNDGGSFFDAIQRNLPPEARNGLDALLGSDSQRGSGAPYAGNQATGNPPRPSGASQHPVQTGSHAAQPADQYQQQPAPAAQQPVQHPNNPPEQTDPEEAAPASEAPGVRVVDTSTGSDNGQNKCPKCGSTEVLLRVSTGTLMCQFCRYEWNEETIDEKFGFESEIRELSGIHMGSGATSIQESTSDVLTLKCQSCGADVVVNTAEATHKRCHWCRNTLSINAQLPNGAVPDGVLPFTLPRETAIENIREFVTSRKFFAHPTFVREFAPEEVVGVYMPYLTMDANASVELNGEGEVQTRSYLVGSDDRKRRVYDADVYAVGRKFDVTVDDVLIESSAERANFDKDLNTNNVINAIQPFDTKNARQYNADYLRGFTSERRNLDVGQIEPMANGRVLSVARSRANETLRRYDRGVRWEREQLTVHGSRWVSLYVPVWLYSYYEQNRGITHYVAVNGRTGQTMGSVPVRRGKLLAVSFAIGVVGTVLGGAAALVVALA